MKASLIFRTVVYSLAGGFLVFTLEAALLPRQAAHAAAPTIAATQKFGPTPGITSIADQSLVPVGAPLCPESPAGTDQWFNARNGGTCSSYSSRYQQFVIDPTFFYQNANTTAGSVTSGSANQYGAAFYFAPYGPPACAPGYYKPYLFTTCYKSGLPFGTASPL